MITLTVNEGMWLTNGDVYGKIVRLPEGADADVWYAITDEEYLQAEAEERGESDVH